MQKMYKKILNLAESKIDYVSVYQMMKIKHRRGILPESSMFL